MDFFTTLGFVSVLFIHSLTIFSVVVTNGFLEDMILVLDLLHMFCHKIKVILT